MLDRDDVWDSDVRRCLRGLSFPCSRDELVVYAREHSCLPQVVTRLQSVPDRRLNSLDDVIANLHEIE